MISDRNHEHALIARLLRERQHLTDLFRGTQAHNKQAMRMQLEAKVHKQSSKQLSMWIQAKQNKSSSARTHRFVEVRGFDSVSGSVIRVRRVINARAFDQYDKLLARVALRVFRGEGGDERARKQRVARVELQVASWKSVANETRV